MGDRASPAVAFIRRPKAILEATQCTSASISLVRMSQMAIPHNKNAQEASFSCVMERRELGKATGIADTKLLPNFLRTIGF
jgi:hypothetical protein